MHLVQYRGFAGTPLTIKDDYVVAMLLNERLTDECKDILAAKEHLGGLLLDYLQCRG